MTGVGFSTALVMALVLTNLFWKETRFGPDSGLEVTSVREEITEHGIRLLGTVKNNGDDPWGYVYVGVNLFDAEGKFVDSCDASVDGILNPGDEQYFKITCGRKKSPLPEYERYDISVIKALYAD